MDDIKFKIYLFVKEYWKYIFSDKILDISNIKIIDDISQQDEESMSLEIYNIDIDE